MQIPGKLVIRTHAPVRRWLMLLTWVLFTALGLYLVFELGRYKAGFDGIDAAKQRAVLQDQISALEKTQRDLRVQLAAANETQVAQSQERADIARSIGDLQAQVSAQQRDLEFYRGLVAQPGTKPASVQVQQLKIVPQSLAGQFLLRLTLTRIGPLRLDRQPHQPFFRQPGKETYEPCGNRTRLDRSRPHPLSRRVRRPRRRPSTSPAPQNRRQRPPVARFCQAANRPPSASRSS